MSHYRITITHHRATNAGLLAAWLLLIAVMQTLDADPDQALADDASQARKSALVQQQHAAACMRVHGIQFEPGEDGAGRMVCVPRVRSTKSAT